MKLILKIVLSNRSAIQIYPASKSIVSPHIKSLLYFSYALEKIPGLMESNDADLRNQAGEAIAVLYEIAREINSVCIIKEETL